MTKKELIKKLERSIKISNEQSDKIWKKLEKISDNEYLSRMSMIDTAQAFETKANYYNEFINMLNQLED